MCGMAANKRCPHGRRHKAICVECNPCPHGKLKGNCAECNGCPHGKRKHNCAECNGCPYGKVKHKCAECNTCPHGKRKHQCAACKLARAEQPVAPEIKPDPEGKHEPFFTIRGHIGLDG